MRSGGVAAVPVRRSERAEGGTTATELDREIGFERLYAEEYEPMIRLAWLMVHNDDDAAEVVHDSFAKVFERWDRLQAPGAYLRMAVVNGCRDRRRRLLFRSRVPLPRPGDVTLEVDDMLAVLDALPPRRRDALVLRFYLGLSEAEIAETLGVRPGTVKSLVHRGLADLDVVLKGSRTTDAGSSTQDGEGR